MTNNLTKRLDSTRQYDGTGNLNNAITTYLYAESDLGFTPEEKLRFLHYLFKGDALTYFQREVEGKFHTYGAAIAEIEESYNPHTKHHQTYRSLRSLRFSEFRAKSTTRTEALDKLSAHILNYAHLVPKNYRNEETK